MSKPVDAFHPAPVRFVPRGGRNERLGHLGLRTPVRLAEADPSGFEVAGILGRGAEAAYDYGPIVVGRPIFVAGDALWMDLHDGAGGRLARARFEAFLASEATPGLWDRSEIGQYFGGTPVIARRIGATYVRSDITREGMRALSLDGAERSRADLVGFLDGNVAVVEGHVRVRLPALVAKTYLDGPNGSGPAGQIWKAGVSTFPRGSLPPAAGHLGDPAALLARQSAERYLHFDEPFAAREPEGLSREAYYGISGTDAFPFHLAKTGFAAAFANSCHGHALGLSVVAEALMLAGRDGGVPATLAPLVAKAKAGEALGSVSAVAPDEFAACLEDYRDLVGGLQAAFPRPANSHGLKAMLRLLNSDVAAEMAASRTDHGDEEALAALGSAR